MDVKLLSGALGAEINGIDLKDASKKNFKIINGLLLEHKVIFFRNQKITPEEQLALAKRFGPLETHVYVKGRDKYPKIVRIIKDPNEKNQWGENWHSDVSSNMELAWKTLDKKIKEKIKDKKAIHSSLGAAFFLNDYKHMKGNGNIDECSSTHPIVRTHPETGKKILFVNWTYTKKIVEMDKKESYETLKKIFEHQARLDLTCRFRWTENAVAIWDNRSVLHYAITDFFPGRGLGHERIMDRIAIEGDRPN